MRPCVLAKRPGVVISFLQELLTYAQVRCEEDVEESVASEKCAVNLCEVNDKQELV